MRALRWSLLPAAVALGLFAEWAALRRAPFEPAASTAEIRLAAADLAVGIILVAAGLTAWWRRPQSRIGLLLCLTGFAWFLGTFAGSGVARVRRPRRVLPHAQSRAPRAHTPVLPERATRTALRTRRRRSRVRALGRRLRGRDAGRRTRTRGSPGRGRRQDASFAPQAQTAARGARPSSHAPRWLRCSSRPRLRG